MNKNRTRYLIWLFLTISVLCLGREIPAQNAEVFLEALGSGPGQSSYEFAKWTFSLGNEQFEIRKNGKATRTDVRKRKKSFKIDLELNEYLERVVYYTQYKNDLLIICETVLDDGSGGHIIRFDRRSLKTVWKTGIPGFNIAKGITEGRHAYLTAIGFIAKIDLDTGKYLWMHDDLYRKYDENGAFNVFQTPELKSDIVLFREEDILSRGFDHQIHVNKSSGQIIRVILE